MAAALMLLFVGCRRDEILGRHILLIVPDEYTGGLEIIISEHPENQSGDVLRFDPSGKMYLREHYQQEFHRLSVAYENGEKIFVPQFDEYVVGNVIFIEEQGKFDLDKYYYEVVIADEYMVANRDELLGYAPEQDVNILKNQIKDSDLIPSERFIALERYMIAEGNHTKVELLSEIVKDPSEDIELRQQCVETLVLNYSEQVQVCDILLQVALDDHEELVMREHVLLELANCCAGDKSVSQSLNRLLNDQALPLELRDLVEGITQKKNEPTRQP